MIAETLHPNLLHQLILQSAMVSAIDLAKGPLVSRLTSLELEYFGPRYVMLEPKFRESLEKIDASAFRKFLDFVDRFF